MSEHDGDRAATKRYEIVEHTADAGIVAHGRTLGEAFAAAAEGMYALMVDLDRVRPRTQRVIEVAAADRERLLVAWLVELLFLTQTEHLVFSRFEVSIGGDGGARLRAQVWGEPFDASRHDGGSEVKAVTKHQLEIIEDDEGYRARVFFDI